MGVVVLHFNADDRLVLVAAEGRLTRRQRALRWLLQRFQRLSRSYRRFANGGIDSRWIPPPFIGWSCPKWAPRPVQRLSWWLYEKWLDRR